MGIPVTSSPQVYFVVLSTLRSQKLGGLWWGRYSFAEYLLAFTPVDERLTRNRINVNFVLIRAHAAYSCNRIQNLLTNSWEGNKFNQYKKRIIY